MIKNKTGDELASKKYARKGQASEIIHRLVKNKGAVVGLCIIGLIILAFIVSAIFISLPMVTTGNVRDKEMPPNAQHLFGTDQYGRDMFNRVLYGSRYSLAIGFGGSLIAITFGVFLGCLGGYYGGVSDMIVMRLADVLMSIPGLLLGMVIMSTLGSSLINLVLCIGITSIPFYIRMSRASILSLRNLEFVEAAHAIGLSNFRIIFAHILPNGLSPLIITFTMNIGAMILSSSSLSFLGFGIAPPLPEWGVLITGSRDFMRNDGYLLTFPGVFIMLTVLAFNMFGDGLRDALDPKLKVLKVVKPDKRGEADESAETSDQTAGDNLLDIKNLVVQYVLEDETVEAVNKITLGLKAGQTLGLVGETGAGKTSTALAVLNLVQTPPGVIKSGSIKVCGSDVLSMTPKQLEKIRGKDVSMIFQDPMTALNPVMTVVDQIAESIKYHEGLSLGKSIEKAVEILELVGIPAARANEYPHQFSGGMKQRVVIAIALACNPRVLLADEPTSALDVTIQAQVLDMMRELKAKLDTTLIMITHDLGVVAKICDSVAVMYAGKIVEYGTLRDVFNNPKHPYTEGLFNSLPNIRERKAELKPIPGLMPDPTKLPPGCAFEPRCQYAVEACKRPLMTRSVSQTHSVLCSRYDEPDFNIEMKRGATKHG